MKVYQDKNVFEAAKERIKIAFTDFEKVYISFLMVKIAALCLIWQ